MDHWVPRSHSRTIAKKSTTIKSHSSRTHGPIATGRQKHKAQATTTCQKHKTNASKSCPDTREHKGTSRCFSSSPHRRHPNSCMLRHDTSPRPNGNHTHRPNRQTSSVIQPGHAMHLRHVLLRCKLHPHGTHEESHSHRNPSSLQTQQRHICASWF